MKTIGSLNSMPKPNVYRRSNGKLYLKLNDGWHVETYEQGGNWKGAGVTEKIDPSEMVEVVQ